MRPAPGLPIVELGRSNCGVLKRLKNSARYWTRQRSEAMKSLNMDQSKLTRPGPRRMFLPELPKVNWAGTPQAAFGLSKETSYQRKGSRFSSSPDLSRTGRLPPALETDVCSDGVKGRPVCAVKMRLVSQPPARAFKARWPKS